MRFAVALIFLLSLACQPARAGDEPETVYERYHRAAIAGRLDEMLLHGLVRRREEMQGASVASREAALTLARSSMPREFALDRKTVDGNRAILLVSGSTEGAGGKPRTIFGEVKMRIDSDMWKVDEVVWDTEGAGRAAARKPPPPPAAGKAAVSTTGAPVVGSMKSGQVGRKLGAAKPVCEFKPVMTAQDLELCK